MTLSHLTFLAVGRYGLVKENVVLFPFHLHMGQHGLKLLSMQTLKKAAKNSNHLSIFIFSKLLTNRYMNLSARINKTSLT